LPWRERVLLYSEPTFPSQVLLISRADSPYQPIRESGSLEKDIHIQQTKSMIGKKSLLVMERTCLDPANYGLKGMGIDLRAYNRSTNLNEKHESQRDGPGAPEQGGGTDPARRS